MQRLHPRSSLLTTDPAHVPPDTTWLMMTNQPGTLAGAIGNTFGLRTWMKYGFKQVKDELDWADYRVTDARTIVRWRELVMSAYVLVSLQSPVFATLGTMAPRAQSASLPLAQHPWWTARTGWKPLINNLRLLLHTYVATYLLLRTWIQLLHLPQLAQGLALPAP